MELFVGVSTLMPYYDYEENQQDDIRMWIKIIDANKGVVRGGVVKIELIKSNYVEPEGPPRIH